MNAYIQKLVYSQNFKNSFWNFVNALIYPLVLLIATPYFIHDLGVEQYGIWMLMNSITQFNMDPPGRAARKETKWKRGAVILAIAGGGAAAAYVATRGKQSAPAATAPIPTPLPIGIILGPGSAGPPR